MTSKKPDLEALQALAGESFPQSVVRTYKDAFALASKLCGAGVPQAHYWCGCLYLSGRGVPKNVVDGHRHLLLAVCLDPACVEALVALSDCYRRGIGAEANPIEAYIWAILARAENDELVSDELLGALENEIGSPIVTKRAQREANERYQLRGRGELTPEYCLERASRYKPPAEREAGFTRAYFKADAVASASKLDRIRKWRIENTRDLTLAYFLETNKITFRHTRSKQTFKARDIFSERCLSLLKVYWDARQGQATLDYHARQGQATLDYHARNVAADAGCNRENHSIVDDFNHEFRKLFGLDTRHKAFRWLGKGKGRQLAALITLEII
ncbi:MAG: SEL1-like repeat protein [Candidatus Syntrophosphaera sp.]|nr:SEL1-like repeat protein [Candidatus Syntrophosphaera sp.]